MGSYDAWKLLAADDAREPEPDDDHATCAYCSGYCDPHDPTVVIGGDRVNGWIVAHEECTGTCGCGRHYSLRQPPRLRGGWTVCERCYAAQTGEGK